MASCLFKELLDRSKQVVAQTPAGEFLRKELMTVKIISEDGSSWHQMAWSQEKQQLLPTDGQRLTILQARDTIQELYELCQSPGLILRFHALRAISKLAKDGSTVVFLEACHWSQDPKATRKYTLPPAADSVEAGQPSSFC